MNDQAKPITSLKKHVVPAFYTWMNENHPRVHLGVLVDHPLVIFNPMPPKTSLTPIQVMTTAGPQVARMIILNTHPDAVKDFKFTDEAISFVFRINGAVTEAYIPYEAVVQMTAPELGLIQEFGFDCEFLIPINEAVKAKLIEVVKDDQTETPVSSERPRPKLTLVSNNQ